jgi:Holliday junction resolvase RusA-like endonuclease
MVMEINLPIALAPIPSLRADPERFIRAEEQVTTAAKAAMVGRAPLKGPLAISLSVTYPPSASQRKGHAWRVTAPCTWDLARFILPLLQGVYFVSAGQIAKLEVTKTYGERALTIVTISPLVAENSIAKGDEK